MSKIKFHPFFIIYVFVCIYCEWFNGVFYYVVSVILHEYGHYFMAKILGYESQGIIFNVYGAGLQSNNIFKNKDELMISVAGPLVNLVLIILTICSWWLFPASYMYSIGFLRSNLSVMIFNLIPIYPLDGGRILVSCLSRVYNKNKILKINKVVGIITGIVFCSLFVVSVFVNININLLIIGIFVTFTSIYYDKNMDYQIIKSLTKTTNEKYEVRLFKVDDCNKVDMLKHLSPNYYSIFIKVNNGEKRMILEDDLLK